MGKKKFALFYDESTESGKQILDFLSPFTNRKSDIVGELILFWISEHGTTVPVQWLDRKKGELGSQRPIFAKTDHNRQAEDKKIHQSNEKEVGEPKSKAAVQEPKQSGNVDEDLIKAGLASFL